MDNDHPFAARGAWDATFTRVSKKPEELDTKALLARLESEMGDADPTVQWTMNFTLASIGIQCPKLRKRAVALGEKLGLYRDYPTAKGCTSPFVPTWVAEMVSREK